VAVVVTATVVNPPALAAAASFPVASLTAGSTVTATTLHGAAAFPTPGGAGPPFNFVVVTVTGATVGRLATATSARQNRLASVA
jgi:hypothetical protein